MKAFLLAAGLGTRLRPLTDTVPKCLVPIRGQPLLGWWFQLLLKNNVTEVLVNTHYLDTQVRSYIDQYNKQKTGLTAIEYYEKELLGSGGTVRENRNFVKNEESFFICYADNLTNIKLSELHKAYLRNNGIVTIALFHAEHPEQCGIVELGENEKVLKFEEKPEKPKSDLANAGVYIANNLLFDYISDDEFVDFGKDVLPKLSGNMYGWKIKDYIIDVGTYENYIKAIKEWPYDHN